MTEKFVTKSGEEHGLIKSVGNSVPFDDFKHFSPANKAKAEKLKKEEHRIVKARYINYRGPNERLSTEYCRWSGDPIESYHLIPGETYPLPMGLVNQVNDPNKWLKQRTDLLDAYERPILKEGPGEKVHELVSVEF